MATTRVAVVSGDLMFESRLRQALPEAVVEPVRAAADVPADAGLVAVDLNREAATRVELIAGLREQRPALVILGFCHHGEREVRTSAMAAGATEVVTNGAVAEAASRLVGVEVSGSGR